MSRNTAIGEINAISLAHNFNWTIRNFCASCKKTGQALFSPIVSFVSDGVKYDWQLALFPKGQDENAKDFMSLHLYNLSKVDVLIIGNLSILLPNGLKKQTRKIANNECIKKGAGLGVPKFFELAKKELDIILKNDELAINCEIKINRDSNHQNDGVVEYQNSQRLKNLSDDFQQLINQKDFSDFAINVQGKTLHAHKSILGKRSRVFAAMLQHNMREKKLNKVDIQDIRFEVFQELLRFMYSGKVNNIEAIASELLAAANKYSLDGLAQMCEEALANALSVANVFESFQVANQFDAKNLRSQVIRFLALHANEVVNKPEFRQLSSDAMYQVCQALARNK